MSTAVPQKQPTDRDLIENVMDPYFLISQNNRVSFLNIIETHQNKTLLKQQIISLLDYRIIQDHDRLLDHVRKIVIYSVSQEHDPKLYEAVTELFSVLGNKGKALKENMFRLVKSHLTSEQQNQLKQVEKNI